MEGNKIAKGHLQSVTNKVLVLRSEKNDSVLSIPVSTLGKLLTKRSIGGNILIGTIMGGCLGYGLLNNDSDGIVPSSYSGNEAVVAITAGMILGAATGVGTSVF